MFFSIVIERKTLNQYHKNEFTSVYCHFISIPCSLFMPRLIVFTSEEFTKEEKKAMIKDLSEMITQATTVPYLYHTIFINDGIVGSWGGETDNKVIYLELLYAGFTREIEEKLAKLFFDYFIKRGYDSDRIQTFFTQQAAAHYAINGVLCDTIKVPETTTQ